MSTDHKIHYLCDQWTTIDRLSFSDFQPALKDILQTVNTPLTLGIFGPWGSGKTSLMQMLREEIESEQLTRIRTVWFTAWKYDHTQALWRAFILRVLGSLYPRESGPGPRESRPIIKEANPDQQKQIQLLQQLEKSIYQSVEWETLGNRDIDWGKLIGHSTLAGADIATSLIPGTEILKKIIDLTGDGDQASDSLKKALSAISKEVQDHHRDQLYQMEQFEKTFSEIVAEILGENGRLIVFVDDLDRCLPEKSIQILEAIKLFLEVPGTVFVLGMDQRVVQKGIESRYQFMFKQASISEAPISGESYLQKMIQIPFHLPGLNTVELTSFIYAHDKTLHKMVVEIFAHGVLPNPRQIKRTINIFRLLQQIAQKREQAGKLEKGVISWALLAKTVVIQTQHPEIFQLWRQYPTLIQSLEEEFIRNPIEEDFFFDDGQDENEISNYSQNSNHILSRILVDRQQNFILRKLLSYPSSIPSKSDETERVYFMGLSRNQLLTYIYLADTFLDDDFSFTQQSKSTMNQLLSGDIILIQDGCSFIESNKSYVDALKSQRIQTRLLHIMSDEQRQTRERISAGMSLGLLGDIRQEVVLINSLKFCWIPPGEFLLGNAKELQDTSSLINIGYGYWIAQIPITQAHFKTFVEEGGYNDEKYWLEAKSQGIWLEGKINDRIAPITIGTTFDLPNCPVTGITWYEALAFTRWLSSRWQEKGWLSNDWIVTLPSEIEWEKAAKGGTYILQEPIIHEIENLQYQWSSEAKLIKNSIPDRLYPWGHDIAPDLANYKGTKVNSTTPVGAFPLNLSIYGIMELSGNIYEWTRSLYAKYPYIAQDGRENIKSTEPRILRGGSWRSEDKWLCCKERSWHGPLSDFDNFGFRIAIIPLKKVNKSKSSETVNKSLS